MGDLLFAFFHLFLLVAILIYAFYSLFNGDYLRFFSLAGGLALYYFLVLHSAVKKEIKRKKELKKKKLK